MHVVPWSSILREVAATLDQEPREPIAVRTNSLLSPSLKAPVPAAVRHVHNRATAGRFGHLEQQCSFCLVRYWKNVELPPAEKNEIDRVPGSVEQTNLVTADWRESPVFSPVLHEHYESVAA